MLGQEGQPRVPPLASRLNDALHHLGAWQELLDPQQAERTFADLLEPVTCLVEQLGPLLVDHPLVFLPEGEEGALVLRLPGPACPLPGRYALRTSTPGATNPTYLPLAGLLVRLDPDRPGQIGLYRGIIGHRLRWWGYDGTRSATAPLPRAAARLAGDFGDLAGGAAALHPDLLVWAGQARLEPQPQAGPRPALPSADRLPLPLARTVIALRQARSAAERLAAVDTSFAVLLRLAAFLSVSTEHRDGWMGFLWPKVVHPRRPTWLARATKRNLLDLILTRGHAPCGLRDLLAGPAATELVNLLERIEHLPAAAAEVEEEVDSAAQWLSGLLEASPWGSAANDRPVLWGLARGQCWRLMGSAPGLDDQPAAAVAGLPDGSLYVQAGGEIYPLGPFATLASATGEEGSLDVWLLDEEKDGRLPPEKASLWLFALGFRGLAGDRTRQGRQQGRWVEEGVGVRLALGAS
ncbi:MAG: hypothetical protein FJ125_09025 [Deltaproteobacteria bacterium]|nr:hypothetical protein [Deltaproteobacteria bacterium]